MPYPRGKRARPHGVRERNGYEALGLCLGQAAHEISPAHAGIDENRHGPGLEQREHERIELDARRHKQREARGKSVSAYAPA